MKTLIKSNQKGLTFVEVIVSMAILSIIVVTFLMVFSTGFTNIFASGNKSDAMSLASDKMEQLYAGQPFEDKDTIKDELENISEDVNGTQVDKDDLTEFQGTDFNFHIETVNPLEKSGYNVTIVAFYQNGENYVTLSSFIRGGN